MRSKAKRLLLLILIGLALCITASAHSGGTDSQGGHTNSATGQYHYHHGYEAHQHPGGVCPYRSQSSSSSYSSGSSRYSGSSSGYSSGSSSVSTQNTTSAETEDGEKKSSVGTVIFIIVLCVIFLVPGGICLAFAVYEHIDANYKKKFDELPIDLNLCIEDGRQYNFSNGLQVRKILSCSQMEIAYGLINKFVIRATVRIVALISIVVIIIAANKITPTTDRDTKIIVITTAFIAITVAAGIVPLIIQSLESRRFNRHLKDAFDRIVKQKEEDKRREEEARRLEAERIAREEEARRQKQEWHLRYKEKYDGKPYKTVFRVPDGLCVDEDFNIHGKNGDGDLTVYRTHSGRTYHRKQCRHAFAKISLMDAKEAHLKPCSLCHPADYDFKWYSELNKTRTMLSRYGITLSISGDLIHLDGLDIPKTEEIQAEPAGADPAR